MDSWEGVEEYPAEKSNKNEWYQSSGQLPAEFRRPENAVFFQFLVCIVSRSVLKVVSLKGLHCMSLFKLVVGFQFKQCVSMFVYAIRVLFLL